VSNVFVLDTHKRPLDPVHPGHARRLLNQGKAAVFRRYPFTIILKHPSHPTEGHSLRIKLDPGATTTGIAIVDDASGAVVFAAELSHRGQAIKTALDGRRTVRHARRRRHTRYRKPRFANRRRKKGWLPPSLKSRVEQIITWVERLRRLCPVAALSLELVKFDLQKMNQPEISGVHYQQGTLAGYEVREYLLEKWERTCAYCGKGRLPLQIEHIQPKSKGGTDRISNLCLACEPCNLAKGSRDIQEFLHQQPERLKKILAQARAPLKDAAAVNSTRWLLFEEVKQLGLPVETGSGGRTKFNRTQRGLPKTHWLDAACVGTSTPATLSVKECIPLLIAATGHGNRQICGVNKYGFPIRHRKRQKVHAGYQTGDLVRAVVPAGLKTAGTHQGRVLARATGSFDIATSHGRVAGVNARYCHPIHRNDGYSYQKGARLSSLA
jgi:5-methylcytosine-specific restriction endonuclease McrA